MQITVKLYASFRLKWFKEAVKECPHGTEAFDIVKEIGIPIQELGSIVINGRHASLHDKLREGDILSLMPLIGGG